MGGRWLYAVVVLVTLVTSSTSVRADDDELEMAPDEVEEAEQAPEPAPAPVKDPKAARKWFVAGQQLVRKGDYAARAKKPELAQTHYENAVTAFERSIEVGEDVNYPFDLAGALEKLERYDLAARHYQRLIKADGVRAEVVKKAEARFDDLVAKIGLVVLEITPEGTTITIDGQEVGRSPLTQPLLMLPGTYTLALAAEGHQPREIEIKVEPGSESERELALEPVQVIVEPVAPAVDDEPVIAPVVANRPSKTPLFVGGGVAIAFVGVATITGILAVGEQSTFDSADATPAERADARDSGKRLALITDLCIVGAVAGGGFAAYWYFTRYRPAQRKSTIERNVARRSRPAPEIGAKVDVVPWVKADAGGFVLAGSF